VRGKSNNVKNLGQKNLLYISHIHRGYPLASICTYIRNYHSFANQL
jgi:hypothetical protein